ncbi:hypothetical protein [Sphaerisporangium rufum]|uniref:hypothetical protein n=1 Tax=Sphaerisporangium rufum TaxID=1381558 RepID=UPI001950227D|nr:hypothetical protein [Sphaerisporangium rufum]
MTLTAALVMGATIAAAGCGGAAFTYVTGGDGQSYFKVPASWRKVDQRSLEGYVFGDLTSATAQARKRLSWTAGYDAFGPPSADHLYIAGGDADRPFAFAMVSRLTEAERDKVSLDWLRNAALLPVVLPEETRQKLEEAPGYPFKGFELVEDEVLPPADGVRGVHVVYNLRVLGGPVQTFDQTAYLAADGGSVSVLLVRCSAACYRERAAEIGTVVGSFKVKRLPG